MMRWVLPAVAGAVLGAAAGWLAVVAAVRPGDCPYCSDL